MLWTMHDDDAHTVDDEAVGPLLHGARCCDVQLVA
jgi:hypothetical protein